MKILKTILLLPLKLLALIVLALLGALYMLAGLVTNLGSFIATPLVIFVLGCAIWCAPQSRWTDVGLLAGIEVLIFAVVFGAVWLTELLLAATDSLMRFLQV